MMKMEGTKKNYEIERGDRRDGGRLTFVPGNTRKNLRISRMKVIREKKRENEASTSNNSKN